MNKAKSHGDASSASYNPDSLWEKLSRNAGKAGRGVVEKALQLHYAARRPDTPKWAKTTAYGALAYFVLPMDAIPDFILGAGYTDDFGVLAMAIATLAYYVNDDVRTQARQRLQRWFGAT